MVTIVFSILNRRFVLKSACGKPWHGMIVPSERLKVILSVPKSATVPLLRQHLAVRAFWQWPWLFAHLPSSHWVSPSVPSRHS